MPIAPAATAYSIANPLSVRTCGSLLQDASLAGNIMTAVRQVPILPGSSFVCVLKRVINIQDGVRSDC